MNPLTLTIGPFSGQDGDDWPVYDRHALRDDGFIILPFSQQDADSGTLPDAEVLVWWSPEYHAPPEENRLRSWPYTVACVGDWHIVPFDRIPGLPLFDLVATDLRGTKQPYFQNHEAVRPIDVRYFRMFSFDPRLHYLPLFETVATNPPTPYQRPIDIAFLGRPDGGRRDRFLDRLGTLCARRGWTCHVETTPYRRSHEADIYRLAKIVPNFSQRGELNMRGYEAMACGALSLLQIGAEEGQQAPIPRWQDSTLEATLESWLPASALPASALPAATADAPASIEMGYHEMVAKQYTWVQTERPVDHLRWLCRRIRERLSLRERVTRISRTERRKDEQNAASEPPLHEQRLESVALVPKTARRVLDVGCGNGSFGWALKQRSPECVVVGIDTQPYAHPGGAPRLDRFDRADVEDPAVLAARAAAGERYECITCLDVLEHLRDPWGVLKRLRGLLAQDGCLVASLPNLRNAANLWALLVEGEFRYFRHGTMPFRGPQDSVLSIEHLRFFTRTSIEQVFRECGYRLEVWAESRFTPPLPSSPQDRWQHDLAFLVAVHGPEGGGAERLKEELGVVRWLVRARPDWAAAV